MTAKPVTVIVSPELAALVARSATTAGMTASEWIRRVLATAAGNPRAARVRPRGWKPGRPRKER